MAKFEGPGILYVTSKISRPDILSEDVYFDWYDNDHIDEIVNTDGIKSAFRGIDIEKGKASKPYLAYYPMKDLGFTQGERFKKIRVHSKILPGSGLCYDLADIDVRYMTLVQKHESSNKNVLKSLAITGIEPGDSTSDSDLKNWYDKEQLPMLEKIPGYRRTTRFKLVYARTNAQSRALKGLPTTDEAAPEPPTWLAIHEFDTEDPPVEKMRELYATELSRKIMGGAKKIETNEYRVAKRHGAGKFFED